MTTRKIIAMLLAAGMVIATAGTANAASIAWTADPFDADTDISTAGTLVEAVNLDSVTGVTVNGVVFGADPAANAGGGVDAGNNTFFVTGNGFTDGAMYGGGAIGSLSAANAQTLLDSLEYGPGAGNSRARIDGLTIGQTYEVQLLTVDDRAANSAVTYGYGYSTPSGDATETYTLSGVDNTSSSPYVITGTFTATEALQDIHVASSGPGNGQVAAYQVRAMAPTHSVVPYADNEAGTALLYHLDEPTGRHSMSPGTTFIADTSGNGQDLRTNYDTSNPGSTTSNPGLSPFDGIASVNGLGKAMTHTVSQRAYRVNNANTSIINEDTFTIEAWIRPDTVSSHRGILRVDDDGAGLIQFGLFDSKLRIAGFTTGGFQQILSTVVYPFQADQWYHVAVTYDDAANEVTFFVDPETNIGSPATRAATQLGSTIATGIDWRAFDAAGDIWVGEYEEAWHFLGDIDEVRWSNVVRDAFNLSAEAAVIPEPATMCALGMAIAGLGGYIRKRRRA